MKEKKIPIFNQFQQAMNPDDGEKTTMMHCLALLVSFVSLFFIFYFYHPLSFIIGMSVIFIGLTEYAYLKSILYNGLKFYNKEYAGQFWVVKIGWHFIVFEFIGLLSSFYWIVKSLWFITQIILESITAEDYITIFISVGFVLLVIGYFAANHFVAKYILSKKK